MWNVIALTAAQAIVLTPVITYVLPHIRASLPADKIGPVFSPLLKALIITTAKLLVIPVNDLFLWSGCGNSVTTILTKYREVGIKMIVRCAMEDTMNEFLPAPYALKQTLAAFIGAGLAQANQALEYQNASAATSMLQGVIGGFNAASYKLSEAMGVPIFAAIMTAEGAENALQEQIMAHNFTVPHENDNSGASYDLLYNMMYGS